MKSLAEYIAESIQMPKKLHGTPMQFADLQKTGDFIAKKLKCGIDAYSLLAQCRLRLDCIGFQEK